MFLKLPHGHASVVISQRLSLSKTSLHNYADLFLNVAVFFSWALGNDEVMTPLWLKSSMSALSVHSNCSSFVSLKTNFKVSHLAYIHHNSVIIAVARCPTYAVRLGVFRCFDCKNLIDMNWMIPESISMLQREWWLNNSCSDWGFFFFFLHQIKYVALSICLLFSFFVTSFPSVALTVYWPTWQSLDQALIAMIRPALGDSEWRLDKCNHPDGRGWSGAGWQLPMFLSWDSLLPRRSGHQSPWWVGREQESGVPRWG